MELYCLQTNKNEMKKQVFDSKPHMRQTHADIHVGSAGSTYVPVLYNLSTCKCIHVYVNTYQQTLRIPHRIVARRHLKTIA